MHLQSTFYTQVVLFILHIIPPKRLPDRVRVNDYIIYRIIVSTFPVNVITKSHVRGL